MMAVLGHALMHFISHGGYLAVVVLMALESACIPLPSEVIMPFAGYLAFRGAMTVGGAALAGTAGCVAGSLVAYAVGAMGGRPWLERHGRYILIRDEDLRLADRWFVRHGEGTVFVARLLPVIRTFIALPAGVARMSVGRFVIYSAVGSYLWCLGLAFLGARLGAHWDALGAYFRGADRVLGVLMVAIVVVIVYRRIRD